MAPQQETIYQTPPLAGRPPFATDDDSVYDNQPQQSPRRIRQQPPPDPNKRSSAHNHYDNYFDGKNRDSGIDALGSSMLSGDMSDDDDDENPFGDNNKAPSFDAPRSPIPLAAPKPGYAAPVSGLKLGLSPTGTPTRRTPSPQQMQQIQVPRPLMLVNSMNDPGSPRMMSPSVPSTPHPLQPPMTPITPAFVRPNAREVKFASSAPVLRGGMEETMLPKRGERGDDFWRRFSMVVKEESSKPTTEKESVWLRKTQNGSTSMSRWVWVFGLILLLCIAGGVGLGMWIAHTDTSHNAPKAIGGSADETADASSTSTAAGTSTGPGKVTPTFTVARRDFDAVPTEVAYILSRPSSDFGSDSHVVRAVPPSRHRRIAANLSNSQ